jgi:hypothetical protein
VAIGLQVIFLVYLSFKKAPKIPGKRRRIIIDTEGIYLDPELQVFHEVTDVLGKAGAHQKDP